MKKAQERSANADRARMQGVLNRVHDALRLGMCSSSQNGSFRWCNNDVGVQSQALRVVSELLASYASSVSSLPFFKEILAALEGLLQVQNQQIRCRAAEVCVTVVAECSNGYSVEILASPLARLISSKGSTSASAAIALKNIVEKARASASEQYNHLLRTVSGAGTVQQLVSVLKVGSHDCGVLVAYTELLALLLERLPTERYIVGSQLAIRRILLEYGTSSNDLLAQVAVRALSSLAICSDLVPLVVSDEKLLVGLLEQCLSPLRSTRLKTEALNLVYCLGEFSAFLSTCEAGNVQALASRCLKLLEASCSIPEKWSFETEALSLAAALAIRVLLSTPGRHRMQLFSAGLITVLYSPSTRDKAFNKKIWLLWELVGWIGCFCDRTEEAVLFEPGSSFGELIDCLCAAFFGAVCRKGRKLELGSEAQDGTTLTTQESVAICRTTALLVSSSSQQCISRTHQALLRHWRPLGSVVDSLYAGYGGPGRVVPQKSETLARLYTLSTLVTVPAARYKLELDQKQDRVAEVLVNLIRERHCQVEQTGESSKPLLMLMRSVAPCCSEGRESWSGKDELLFASVWALSVLLRNSEARLDRGHFIDILRKLAGDKNCADGVRWCASTGLACCGYYGFPSLIGQQLSTLREDPTLAEVRLLIPDRKVLQAHGAVLAARCPLLLLGRIKQDNEAKDVVIRLSSRVPLMALEKILEYVYTGVVQLEDCEVPDARALAKKLQLHSLLKQLLNLTTWGEPIETTSLESALVSNIGRQFFDVVLESVRGSSSGSGSCDVCGRSSAHVHAHRAVLSARCDYLEALFRSGMRESLRGTVQVPFRIQVVLKFVQYLYTGKLESSRLGCAWSTLNDSQQLDSIEQAIDLADLSQQWLQQDLQQACVKFVRQGLERIKVSLCPSIMKYAYSMHQVEIVLATASRMAAEYPQLRGSGALDCLDDVLHDLLRTSYVKLAVN